MMNDEETCNAATQGKDIHVRRRKHCLTCSISNVRQTIQTISWLDTTWPQRDYWLHCVCWHLGKNGGDLRKPPCIDDIFFLFAVPPQRDSYVEQMPSLVGSRCHFMLWDIVNDFSSPSRMSVWPLTYGQKTEIWIGVWLELHSAAQCWLSSWLDS